jgi:site-specific DNA recombinase
MGLKWAGYPRVSRVGDRGETLISPELQEKRIRAAAARHGVEVEVFPPELDVSGGRKSRPILDEIIEGIESGIYAGVIVPQVDRLSRMGLADAVATVERIAAAKGGVISDAEGLITDASPEGQFKRDIFLSLANLQLNRAKAGFIAAKRRAVEQGYWPTNTAPLGYQVEHRKDGGDGRLRPDESTRHLPRLAMEMRVAGRSWAEVAGAIGRGPTGARKVVRNRAYLGEIRLVVDGEAVVNPMAHEPLVDRTLFEAAQLEHPPPARRGNPPALLAGLIRCAGCGYRMSRSSAGGAFMYVCRPNKARGRCPAPAIVGCVGIDRHVEQQVLAYLTTFRPQEVERGEQVEGATRALANDEAELAEFQRAVSAAGVGAEHVADGLRQRVAAVESSRRRLAETWRAQAPVSLPPDIGAIWQEIPLEKQRHFLRSVLSEVVVEKGRRDLARRVRIVTVDDADLPEVAVEAREDPVQGRGGAGAERT